MESEDAESLINKGNDFYKAKNYEEAIKYYEKVIQLEPENASAYHNWGLVFSNLAQDKKDNEREYLLNNALEKYEKATQLDPNNASIFFSWGNAISKLAVIKQDYVLFQNAFEKYKKAAQLDPNNDSIFSNWGYAIFRLAEINKDENKAKILFQEAFEKYKKAAQLDPNNASTFNHLGNVISKLAEIKQDHVLFQNAFEKYYIAAQLDPNDASIFFDWGNAISKLAETKQDNVLFQSAFEKYYIATQLDPNDAIAFNNWGYAISKLAEIKQDYVLFQSAFEKYEKATQLDPNNDSIFYCWGNAISKLAVIKQNGVLFQNAFEKYNKATKLNPNYALAFSNWGVALYKLAEISKDENKAKILFQEAIEKYEKATQLNSNDFLAFNNWGSTISRLAEINKDENKAKTLFKEAFEKYEKATQLNPNYASAFFNWGFAYSKLAEINKDENEIKTLFQNAFEKYEKATQLDKNDASIFYNWGNAIYKLAEINKNETLQINLEPLEKMSEDIKDPNTLLVNGNLYFTLNQLEQGSKYEEKVKMYFKKSEKDILEILTFLDEKNRKKIIETKILHSLLNSDSNNDTFFKETTKNLTPEQLDEYKEIYIRSIFIISLLYINNENEKLVAHYREKDVSQILLFGENSKLRLNAINYSNDPTEGKTLLEFLYEKEKRPSDEELDTEYEAFAGCFTFNYDSLNQFRLYGKKGDKEGTGLSLVFYDNFFSKEAKMAIQKTNSSEINNNNSIEKDKLPLFRCIYIDPNPETKQPVITIGQKEEYLFYRESTREKFEDYNKKMKKIIEDVREEMKKLKELVEGKNLDLAIIGQLLLNLRYLVKHVAFKEEQECRIVKILNLSKDKKDIKDDEFKQMYFEYPFAVPMYIDKIYFGPKAEGFELFKSMLKYKGLDNIRCERSTNPLA